MPRAFDLQSGPDDLSDAVGSDGQPPVLRRGDDESDMDDDGDSDTRRRQRKQPASSSSQQVNHVKQSAVNASEAASSAVLDSSLAENTGAGHDLALKTLEERYKRQLKDLQKERKAFKREREESSSCSKRSKSSSSRRNSSDSSDSDSSSDGDNHGHGGGHSSNSKDSDGKDITLRQFAITNKFINLKYVDISIFSRANLNVRKSKKLQPISSGAEFSAAWASFNVELQQYLINANRGADALMVSKYYSQLVRLVIDYHLMWRLVIELDEYIRGAAFKVNDHIVWSIDRDDDYVSTYRYDIRMKHLHAASRTSTASTSPSQRDAPPSNLPRGGNSASTVAKPRRSLNICYAYNGEVRPNEWTNINHCRGKDKCKFQHKCMICACDHAVYENKDCAARPRARTSTPFTRLY